MMGGLHLRSPWTRQQVQCQSMHLFCVWFLSAEIAALCHHGVCVTSLMTTSPTPLSEQFSLKKSLIKILWFGFNCPLSLDGKKLGPNFEESFSTLQNSTVASPRSVEDKNYDKKYDVKTIKLFLLSFHKSLLKCI